MRASLAALLLALATAGAAQEPAPPPPTSTAPADDEIQKAEPDFNVIALPTALRLPRHAWGFRITHRFTRPLGDGDFGDLAGDLFGFDSSAQIGFELRWGLATATQLVLHRTNDRTIELLLQRDVLHPATHAIGVAAVVAVDGLDNFGLSEVRGPYEDAQYSPSGALVLSRRLGERGALYAIPMYVHNTNRAEVPGDDDYTVVLGTALRVRFSEHGSLAAEWAPRLSGFARPTPGLGDAPAHLAFGIERRLGGHLFQINVGNGFGTTLAQVARGGEHQFGERGEKVSNWYLGFNIARKFY